MSDPVDDSFKNSESSFVSLDSSVEFPSPQNLQQSTNHESELNLSPSMNGSDINSPSKVRDYDTSLKYGEADVFSLSPFSPTSHPPQSAPGPSFNLAPKHRKEMSQQSNTPSVTSPQLSQTYSGRSSESLYSRSTSPLEYKSTNNNKLRNDSGALRNYKSEDSHSFNDPEHSFNEPELGHSIGMDQGTIDNEHPFSSTPIEQSGSTDLFLKLKSSQILINANKTTNKPSPDPISIIGADADKSEYHDALNSPGSELDVLEDFIPDLESHSTNFYRSDNDADDGTDSFINDDTQYLVDKARSFAHPGISALNADERPIGVKKEKSVIDSLKQEIFQLKLHIVIMESQLNTSSNSGVAQLKSRLAESEAARIAMKNENDKLRHTMASLNEEEKDDSNEQIQALEEELLAYETALGEAQEDQEYLKVIIICWY